MEVAPSDRRKRLLGGEYVVDIVIGDVHVYWDVLVAEVVRGVAWSEWWGEHLGTGC